MSNENALDNLRLDIAEKLVAIDQICRDYNLPYGQITCIIRTNTLPSACVVVTSEDEEGLKSACIQAVDPERRAPDYKGGTPRVKTGIELIAAERARHANMWSEEHDNGHYCGEMACAAAVYATPPMQRTDNEIDSQLWPDGWEQKDYARVCELTVAGALIAAEIDRLQRAKGDT